MAKTKKLQIGTLDYKRIYDWSGGMNDFINPALLNDNESARLENASLDVKGTIISRKGCHNRFSQDISTSPVAGMSPYYKSDGTSRILIATRDGKIYTDKSYLSFTYDLQSDWKQEGVYTNLDADTSPGSITMKVKQNAEFIGGSPTYDKMWI